MKHLIVCLVAVIQCSFGQNGAMAYNNYARTLASFALGEQGVASRNGIDGLIYNPATLIHSQGTTISFFRNPFYYVGFDGLPMISAAASIDLPHDVHIGAEYMSWDHYFTSYGSLYDPSPPQENHYYNRTFALAAATRLSPEWGAGILARYSKDHYGNENMEHFFGSAGLQYLPSSFQDQLRIGFSLMNFSTPLKYTIRQINGQTLDFNDAPSSLFRFGFEYDIARHDLFSTTIHAQVSKELTKRNGSEGQSSFQSLFNDWHDAPRDMSIHGGVSFVFEPIPLTKSVTFVQEIYAGYLHDGPKAGRRTMFYNGFNTGLGFGGTELVAGYAGLWHIVNNEVHSLFLNEMPWETFQISLRTTIGGVNALEEHTDPPALYRLILSIGAGYIVRTGRFAEQKILGPSPEYYTITTPNGEAYSIESAMYLSERSALIAHFRYEHRSLTYTVFSSMFGASPFSFIIPLRMETLTLSSAYRFHPWEEFSPFFLETGIGVQRQNPIEETRPRYKYNTTFSVNSGILLPISTFAVIPRISLTTLLDRINGSQPHLGGYNHFEFSLTIGYLFE